MIYTNNMNTAIFYLLFLAFLLKPHVFQSSQLILCMYVIGMAVCPLS